MRSLIALLFLTAAAFAGDLPDPLETPGVINRDVTQANIHHTICVPGWTKTIRPPVSYTNRLKAKQLPPGADLSAFEEDHLIAIELGGHPRDQRNLWAESYSGKWGARTKDRLENFLRKRICSGTMPLAEAQVAIGANWIEAYRKYLGGQDDRRVETVH